MPLPVYGARPMTQGSTSGEVAVESVQLELDELTRLKREAARLRAILASTGDALMGVSPEGIIWECNRAAEELFRYSASDMIGKSVDALIGPAPDGSLLSSHLAVAAGTERTQMKATAVTREGASVEVSLTLAAVPNGSVNESGFSIVVNDRTERLHAERQLMQSLADKDALLREVHHRVKNNLQIICSMLRLQSSYLPECMARAMFRSSEERVYAMGLVHDKLYRSMSYSAVDIAGYVEELARQLTRPYLNGKNEAAVVTTDVVPSMLPLDRAVPFGLLLNELLSNALKHGCADDGSRSVAVSLSRVDAVFRLLVSDRGGGLPEGLSVSQPRTLGLRLVHALSQQLYGHLSYRYEGGAHFCVEFPSLEEGKGTNGINKSHLHSHM